jgi:capsular polysaccharide biosynthesis protein
MEQQSSVGIGDLQYVTMRDARVLPGAVTSTNGSVRGGVAPVEGSPEFIFQLRQVDGKVVSLTRFRHGDPTGVGREGESPTHFPGTYVYLGPLHRHFGHFVTESITRIWYSLLTTAPDLDLVVLPEIDSVEERENFSFDKLQPWQQDIFKYFGVERRLHFVRSTSIFENLIVPQQGGILFSVEHAETYLDALTSHRIKLLGTPPEKTKVFYQRPQDVPYGKIAGEEYIGKFLSECGYQAVYPELLSGSEQIQLANAASKVISTQGSALHVFNLLGRCEADVLVLQRSTARALKDVINTVEPYVGSVTIHDPAAYVHGGANSSSRLQMIDVEPFLLQLTEFDESIDPEIFDYAAYYRAVLADVQAFTRSISK